MNHVLITGLIQKVDYIIEVVEKMKQGSQPYLNLEDAAAYLGISKSTIYKHTANGKIQFSKPNGKLIMFRKQDLDQWLEKNNFNNLKPLL